MKRLSMDMIDDDSTTAYVKYTISKFIHKYNGI